MYDPSTLAAQMQIRELDRAAARGPRLVPQGTAARVRRHVHVYSVVVVAISLASVVTIAAVSLPGFAA